jgi:hypothetical protein
MSRLRVLKRHETVMNPIITTPPATPRFPQSVQQKPVPVIRKNVLWPSLQSLQGAMTNDDVMLLKVTAGVAGVTLTPQAGSP